METIRANKVQAVATRRTPGKRRAAISGVTGAAELIGPIAHGEEITGVTNGQFSLIDLLEHILTQTGPADLTVSTWTMGIYDMERASAFCANGMVRSARWIVDPSMFTRRTELSGKLVERFGIDSFRAVNTHAKFATVINEDWAISIRTSMNLNPNHRLENFDITEGAELAAIFTGLVDAIFRQRAEGDLRQAPSLFKRILAEFEAQREAAPTIESLLARLEADETARRRGMD